VVALRLTNANDTRGLIRRIVQDTLSHIVVQVSAVVICLYGVTFGVVGIRMECVEMCTYPFDRCEVLSGISKYARD
jgi:hypothetical protein